MRERSRSVSGSRTAVEEDWESNVMRFGRWKGVEWVWGSNWDLVGAAGAGDAVGDVELEDAVEICQSEVEIGIKLEDCGRGGGVEGHGR